ncbi:hypothetical protein [Streptosporangium sp. NPDC049644]|uniref:hypothetical protein n=1 Tax=Streptosporangium sp. NPDC049644 TaxID=3155507 RepID=UPI0034260258
MTNRPRASLQRILEDLGSTVLDVAAPGELDAEVTGVHIYRTVGQCSGVHAGVKAHAGVPARARACPGLPRP